jgi:hypothetical protein
VTDTLFLLMAMPVGLLKSLPVVAQSMSVPSAALMVHFEMVLLLLLAI